MYNHLLYFAYWLVNSAVLYAFSSFSNDVVLGNWRFGAVEAAIYAGFWVTFLVWAMWDFAIAKKVTFDTGVVTLGYFWLVNAFSFWLVSRFSEYTGFGITNFSWAFVIGLVAYLVQRITRSIVVGGV